MPTLDELRRWARGEAVEGFPASSAKRIPYTKNGKPLADVFREESKQQEKTNKKLKYKISDGGEDALLQFGKYRGRTLKDIHAKDPGYTMWLLAQDFVPADLKDVVTHVRARTGDDDIPF
jgi:hypothetical protein